MLYMYFYRICKEDPILSACLFYKCIQAYGRKDLNISTPST